MEITIKEPEFKQDDNVYILRYWMCVQPTRGFIHQSALFDKDTLVDCLIETGFIQSSDGTLVTIALLSESDEPSTETYTLDEFLPMMSNASWKDVATFIENSKKD